MTLQGAKELQLKFKRLEAVASARKMRAAVLKAARPIAARARELAPIKTGLLRRSIGIHPQPIGSGRKAEYAYTIGLPNHLFRGAAFYGGILEFGAKTRGVPFRTGKGSGEPPGIKPVRFLRKAFRQKRQIARFRFSDEILKQLSSEARRG